MKSFLKYCFEFLVILAPIFNNIQFLVFTLLGIEYDPDEGIGGGLVATLNVGFCLYCMAWVVYQEMTSSPVNRVKWPYFAVIVPILIFFLESTFFDISMSSFAGKQFLFYGVFTVPAVYLSTYIYRHHRFDIVVRHSDLIMLLCTLALTLNLPNMLLGLQVIAGGGTHQDISYGAAFCFAITMTALFSGNNEQRFQLFKTRLMKYFYFALLPLQMVLCFLGGGRGGSAMIVFSFFVIMFLYSRTNLKRSILWGVAIFIVFAIVANSSGVFSSGFGRAFDYIQDGSVDLTVNRSDEERTQLRELSYQIIGESPIVGYGLWNGLKVAGYYMHNIFLDVTISGGCLYLFLFLLFLKKAYKSAYYIVRYDNNRGLLMAWMLYPTTKLLFSGFYLTSGVFWFCITYSILCANQSKKILYEE